MKIIKVKSCIECPLNKEVNGLKYCSHKKFKRTMGRVFKEDELPHLWDHFPRWCGLPDNN